ncbi:hypothetical protein HFN78_14240 [Rhizobium laguerreae]|uniref:hypothetical protein n=1 Tax=Rhizobium laguerreae TaxID=1076926 RepID=UPI001C9031CA|nr:hypothetical protein [Rhizobium laguerreae]MBY3472078.1 hypothetical protein [Rhizobium laguerreae]
MLKFPLLTQIIRRMQECLPSTFVAPTGRPWVLRGTADAVTALGIRSTDDVEMATIWSIAFERGAQDAARFAEIVLSDPAINGREIEATKLIGEGLGHAEILAKLRASAPGSAAPQSDERKIVAFPSREGRA